MHGWRGKSANALAGWHGDMEGIPAKAMSRHAMAVTFFFRGRAGQRVGVGVTRMHAAGRLRTCRAHDQSFAGDHGAAEHGVLSSTPPWHHRGEVWRPAAVLGLRPWPCWGGRTAESAHPEWIRSRQRHRCVSIALESDLPVSAVKPLRSCWPETFSTGGRKALARPS